MKKLLGIIACFTVAYSVSAQLTQESVASPNAPGGRIYFYQYKPPHYNSNTDLLPLIISLHGGGEGGPSDGSDLSHILLYGLPKLVNDGSVLEFTWQNKTEGFIMLAPQTTGGPTGLVNDWPLYYTDEMIAYGIANLRVDPSRVFLTGYSLGGAGTWKYATSSVAAASKLAGIVPAAATPGGTDFCNIAANKVAAWVQHAYHDQYGNVPQAIAYTNAVNACSSLMVPAVDTIYPEGSHDVYMFKTYDVTNNSHYPNLFQWMLKVNRNLDPATNQSPVPVIAGPAVVDLLAPVKTRDLPVLDGSASFDNDDIIMDYLWEQTTGSTVLLPAPFFEENYSATNLQNDKRRQWPVVTIPLNSVGIPVGSYTFRLRVKDYLTSKPGHTVFATKTINVSLPANGFAAPATDAGGSITIPDNQSDKRVFGNAYAYSCTGCDLAGYSWVQLSGPSTAVLKDYNDINVNYTDGNYVWLTNLANPGVYTFQFSARSNHGDVGTDILTITKLGAALPVSYAWFNGKNAGNTNIISWATTAEVNSDRFDILRSTDGVSFTVVSSVTSRGGALLTEYTFDDSNAPLGISYYRLSQVDKDGRTSLSKTISVNNKKAGIYIEKYPNPAHDNLTVTVQGTTNGSLQMTIADMQGKSVMQQQWQKGQSLIKKTISVAGLQSGVYQMIITMGQEEQISSFVKY